MSTTRPIRKPDFTARDIGDQTLLYSAKEEVVHILTPPVQFIWKLCDGQHTLADIEQAILTNFSISDKCEVRQCIRHVLDILTDKGLLQQPA